MGFRVFRAGEGFATPYVAYLDEFGHIGPFISRSHPAHKTSPVFGLGGIVLPHESVREFATWFYKLKCQLLDFEIKRDGVHPGRWEKKGSALLTTQNIETYPELRRAMNRILNRIEKIGGFVFYIGFTKHMTPDESSSEQLYSAVLRLAIQRLNKQCVSDGTEFMLVLDESDTKFHRDVILRKAALTMFGADFCSRLVEPPFQVCSHLYQTLQCADWICGLLGRIGAYDAEPAPEEFGEFKWAREMFADRLDRVSRRSSIRTKESALQARAKYLTVAKVSSVLEIVKVQTTLEAS